MRRSGDRRQRCPTGRAGVPARPGQTPPTPVRVVAGAASWRDRQSELIAVLERGGPITGGAVHKLVSHDVIWRPNCDVQFVWVEAGPFPGNLRGVDRSPKQVRHLTLARGNDGCRRRRRCHARRRRRRRRRGRRRGRGRCRGWCRRGWRRKPCRIPDRIGYSVVAVSNTVSPMTTPISGANGLNVHCNVTAASCPGPGFRGGGPAGENVGVGTGRGAQLRFCVSRCTIATYSA